MNPSQSKSDDFDRKQSKNTEYFSFSHTTSSTKTEESRNSFYSTTSPTAKSDTTGESSTGWKRIALSSDEDTFYGKKLKILTDDAYLQDMITEISDDEKSSESTKTKKLPKGFLTIRRKSLKPKRNLKGLYSDTKNYTSFKHQLLSLPTQLQMRPQKVKPTREPLFHIKVEVQERAVWENVWFYLSACIAAISGDRDNFIDLFISTLVVYEKRGAFIFLYLFLRFVIGYPILVIDMAIGQFSGCSVLKCWSFAPLFKGLGYVLVLKIFIRIILDSVFTSWLLHHFTFSFFSVGWNACNNKWNSPHCIPIIKQVEKCPKDTQKGNDGTCRAKGDNKIVNVWNYTLVTKSDQKITFGGEEYFLNHFLSKDSGHGNDSVLNVEMVFFLFVLILIMIILLFGKIKTFETTFNVTLPLKFSLIIFLLVYGILYVNISSIFEAFSFLDLLDPQVWTLSILNALNTLSASKGNIKYVSSFNSFHSNILVNAFVVLTVDLVQQYISLCIFLGYLRHVADSMKTSISDFKSWSAIKMVFVMIPMASQDLPSGRWVVTLFFLLILIASLDNQLIKMSIIVDALMNSLPEHKHVYQITLVGVCLSTFLIALPLCSQRGFIVMDRLHHYADGPFYICMFSLVQLGAISYVYGVHRFIADISIMIGDIKIFGKKIWGKTRCLFATLWLFILPGTIFIFWVVVMVHNGIVTGKNTEEQFAILMYIVYACFMVLPVVHSHFETKKKRRLVRGSSLVVMLDFTDWKPSREKDLQEYGTNVKWYENDEEISKYWKWHRQQ